MPSALVAEGRFLADLGAQVEEMSIPEEKKKEMKTETELHDIKVRIMAPHSPPPKNLFHPLVGPNMTESMATLHRERGRKEGREREKG